MGELTAGVDLGGTKIQSVVLADDKVVGTARLATPGTRADEVIAAVATSVRDALDVAGAATADVRAVGIGAPGAVDTRTGHVSRSANVAGFMDDVPLGPDVQRLLGGVPVAVENDVRAAVTGELRQGAGRKYRDFLGVFLGSGVGGGLVLDGVMRRGNGNAGEIGHTTVKPGGRRCGCGRLGCLEAYAGRVSIERRARTQVAKGRRTALFEIMTRKGRDRVTSSVIADALEQDDDLVAELVDQAVEAVGVAVANAQNLLDLDAIIVGGGLGDRLGQPFVRRIAKEMAKNLRVPERPPDVLLSELGDHGGAIGAAIVAGHVAGSEVAGSEVAGSEVAGSMAFSGSTQESEDG